MTIHIFDPQPWGNEYFSLLFAKALRAYMPEIQAATDLDNLKNTTVVLLTDHLSQERILRLKENNCKIVGFNITDSSYISGAIRFVPALQLIDLIFTLTGIQTVNHGHEFVIDDKFNVKLKPKEFLPPEDWKIFDYMRRSGRLQSLPYVPWHSIPDVPREPYSRRSQKALIRGGGHARRFILALFLMRQNLLDTNSGLVLSPYFAGDMNPQFRFCDECRTTWKANRQHYPYQPPVDALHCNSPARHANGLDWDLSDLGQWNNRCPRSFYWMAEKFQKTHGPLDMSEVEKMVSARWLHPEDHMKMLARISFSSDLKWLHSIYAPQRFWEAASAGAINILPQRTVDQVYFPAMQPGRHYMVFGEQFEELQSDFRIDEKTYTEMAAETRALYDQWINPGRHGVNESLLCNIFEKILQL